MEWWKDHIVIFLTHHLPSWILRRNIMMLISARAKSQKASVSARASLRARVQRVCVGGKPNKLHWKNRNGDEFLPVRAVVEQTTTNPLSEVLGQDGMSRCLMGCWCRLLSSAFLWSHKVKSSRFLFNKIVSFRRLTLVYSVGKYVCVIAISDIMVTQMWLFPLVQKLRIR